MSFIKVSIDEIRRCRKAILEGSVLAYPTETIWGLGADISSLKGVNAIFEMKGRAATKAMSLLVRDIHMAHEYAEFDTKIESLMHVFWPGPLTFVLKAKPSVPEEISGSGFVGLRCSSHIFVRQLMNDLPRPITTTSANRTRTPPAQSMSELDWLPDDTTIASWDPPARHESLKGSTVVRFTKEGFEVLRDGDLPVEWLKRVSKMSQIETK